MALFSFTREVFRPDDAWAGQAMALGSAAAGLSFVFLLGDGGLRGEQAASVIVANGLRTASYAWCFV